MKKRPGRPKKAEGEKAVQVGITVPPGLKKDMDGVPERGAVNWSAVAAEAFRKKLQEIQRDRETQQTIKAIDVGHLAFV